MLNKRGRPARVLGQASAEYLMVVAIGMVIILPMIYLFYTHSWGEIERVKLQQIDDICNRIMDNAESVYYQGSPARITLTESFPDGIARMEVQILQEPPKT